jgi:fibronectin type 3 domain-containing protein
VVTADGSAVGDPTPTRGFLGGDTFGFAEKGAAYHDDQDATQTRQVAFPAQEYFVVADRLRASRDKEWTAYWHGRGELESFANRHTWTTDDGPWGDAAKLHAFTLPATTQTARVTDRFNPYGTGLDVGFEGYPDPATDVEDTPGVALQAEGEAADFLSVLVPDGLDGPAPRTVDVSGDGVLAARIGVDDATDRVLVPTAGGTVTADGVETDGALAWTRTAGSALTAWAIHDGTALSVDGRQVVSSDTTLTLSGDVADPSRHELEIADDVEGPYELVLASSSGRELVGATLDGEPVEATSADGSVTLDLDGGGLLRVEYGEAGEVPAAPTNLVAHPGDGFVELSWDAVAGATGYEVLRSTDGGADEPVAETDATTYRDTEVVNGTEYLYRVVAVNEAGAGEPSPQVTATPDDVPPPTPQGLSALPRDGQVDLSWLAADGAESYRVLRDGDPVADVPGTGYTDTDVVNGRDYEYAIIAVNQHGESEPSEPVIARPFTTPPGAVTQLVGQRAPGEVSLAWSGGERADSFTVLRGELGDELAEVATGVDGRSWTDTDVADGTGYVYRVVAVNDAGSSEPSSSVGAVPGCSLHHGLGSDGLVVEAEAFSHVTEAIHAQDDLARFGGGKIVVPRGSEYKNNPDLWTRYDLKVTEPGRYYLQVLGYGASGSNDSVTVAVDDESPFTMNLGTGEWSYRQSPRAIDLGEGSHTLRILSREDGAEVDRFVLWPSSSIPQSTKTAPAFDVAANPECGGGSEAPAAPDPVGALEAEVADGGVDLTWSISRLATSHRIIRNGETVEEVTGDSRWRDRDVRTGNRYRYSVVAINDAGEAEASTELVVDVPLEAPEVTGHWRGAHPVLEWAEVSRAESYTVIRRVDDTETTISTDSPATSLVDRRAEGLDQACYVVAAVNDETGRGTPGKELCLTRRR